jgi:hypothetical protein
MTTEKDDEILSPIRTRKMPVVFEDVGTVDIWGRAWGCTALKRNGRSAPVSVVVPNTKEYAKEMPGRVSVKP